MVIERNRKKIENKSNVLQTKNGFKNESGEGREICFKKTKQKKDDLGALWVPFPIKKLINTKK